MKEHDLINWIRSQGCVPTDWVGPGDDCAVITLAGRRLLVTTDQVLDGVHVQCAQCGPRAAGRKAMARGLSDIAAMAGLPTAVVATVAAPNAFTDADAQALYAGLREVADAFDCPLVGGDVSVWDGPVTISVTVLGEPGDIEPVCRSGAQADDALCVTGRLGGAWRNGRDLTFTPRIAEARALAGAADLHAMIDLSDGLGTDLRHLCAASGVGAEIDSRCIPIHADADLSAALGDGEDYELLFSLPGDQAERLIAEPPCETPIHRIGRCLAGSEIRLIGPNGQTEIMDARGWEHRS